MIFFGELFVTTLCGALGLVKGDNEILAYNVQGKIVKRIPAKGLLRVLDVLDMHKSYAVCREGKKLVVFEIYLSGLKHVAEANVPDPRHQRICALEDGCMQLCDYGMSDLVVCRERINVVRKRSNNREIGWNVQVNRNHHMNLKAVRQRGRLNLYCSCSVVWSIPIDNHTGFCWASNNRELIISKGDTLRRVAFNEHGYFVAQFTSHVGR